MHSTGHAAKVIFIGLSLAAADGQCFSESSQVDSCRGEIDVRPNLPESDSLPRVQQDEDVTSLLATSLNLKLQQKSKANNSGSREEREEDDEHYDSQSSRRRRRRRSRRRRSRRRRSPPKRSPVVEEIRKIIVDSVTKDVDKHIHTEMEKDINKDEAEMSKMSDSITSDVDHHISKEMKKDIQADVDAINTMSKKITKRVTQDVAKEVAKDISFEMHKSMEKNIGILHNMTEDITREVTAGVSHKVRHTVKKHIKKNIAATSKGTSDSMKSATGPIAEQLHEVSEKVDKILEIVEHEKSQEAIETFRQKMDKVAEKYGLSSGK